MESTLAGLRKDINSTNAKLKNMSDTLSDGNSSVPSATATSLEGTDDLLVQGSSMIDGIMEQYSDFNENTTDLMDQIKNKFEDTKNMFGGASFSAPSGSTSGCFSFTFYGKQINFDLCPSLQILSPIIYFVLNVIFMIVIVRFMIINILRGGSL